MSPRIIALAKSVDILAKYIAKSCYELDVETTSMLLKLVAIHIREKPLKKRIRTIRTWLSRRMRIRSIIEIFTLIPEITEVRRHVSGHSLWRYLLENLEVPDRGTLQSRMDELGANMPKIQ